MAGVDDGGANSGSIKQNTILTIASFSSVIPRIRGTPKYKSIGVALSWDDGPFVPS